MRGASMSLSREQIQDFTERLNSFKQRGILPADQAFRKLGSKIITASERGLNPALCLNRVNVSDRKSIDATMKELMLHDTHGFITMAMERHYYKECKDTADLKATITERLFCSMVFIVDVADMLTNKAIIGRENPLSRNITEFMILKGIPLARYKAILVPEGLKELVSSIFPAVELFIAPMRKGKLTLSSFTLSTVIAAMDGARTLSGLNIPDYGLALKNFVEKHPELPLFGTHLTRLSTNHDFKIPFRQFTSAEHEKNQIENNERILKYFLKGDQPAAYEFFSPVVDRKEIDYKKPSADEYLDRLNLVLEDDIVKKEEGARRVLFPTFWLRQLEEGAKTELAEELGVNKDVFRV